MRKDCEQAGCVDARPGGTQLSRPPLIARRLLAAVCLALAPQPLHAASVRLWPTAVVVEDHIRVGDICELRDFDAQSEKQLAELVVADAPSVGGSRLVHLELVRTSLAASGVNLAGLTIRGAVQCAVSRPSTPSPAPPTTVHPTRKDSPSRKESPAAPDPTTTLRTAVLDHFNVEFARYGGTAEVVFDRTSDQVLDLAGPAFEFKVRRRGEPLGLCPLEVDVVSGGKVVQTVPLVVQVTMLRKAVVARRTINLDATVTAGDVDFSTLTFTRLDKLGLESAAMAVGQRARKVIPAGTLIESDMLESVPLVFRGQLVTLHSEAGAVRIVTTGKAGADGRLGEVIKVRSVDDKRVEFDAVVVGPGEVRLGAPTKRETEPQLALGEQR